MSCNVEQLLTDLYRICPAMNYEPLMQRHSNIYSQLNHLIDDDVAHDMQSPDEATLDKALYPVFVAFFMPPPTATAIVNVLSQIETTINDLITVNPTLAWATTYLQNSLSRFRPHITTLSIREPPKTHERQPNSWQHRTYPLYRFHVDSQNQIAYRPLALTLTLRLQEFWMMRHDKYQRKAEERSVEGLHESIMARRGHMARQFVFSCSNYLRPNHSPITIPDSTHFQANRIPASLEKPLRRLFLSSRHYAIGKYDQHSEPSTTPAPAPPPIKTTYGASPTAVAEQMVDVRTLPPPEEVDATAIPRSELEELIVQHRPAHPDLPHERSLQPFLNYRIQIQHAQMAVPSVHDIRIIQMSEYQTILSRLPLATPLNTVNDKDLFMSTITLAVMFYGQKPTVMLQTAITGLAPEPSGFEETKDTIHLEYARSSHTLSYLFPHDWLGYTGPDEHPFLQSCIATTRHVCLPLFAPFADLFQECYWRNAGRIYRESEQHGRALLFNHPGLPSDPNERENHINAWLGKFEPPHRPGRWTLANLAESWFVHTTQRFNMDPVIALWVSGQRQWAVRAPSQYTAFPAARLVRDLKALHMKWWKLLDAAK